MTHRVLSTSWHAGTLRLFALLLLATSLLMPRGFMPARDAHGVIRVMLCTGTGPVSMTMVIPFDKDHQDHDGHKDGQPDKTCAFASNAAPLAAADNVRLPAPIAEFDLHRNGAPLVGLAPGRGMAAPPPPSQAPPVALS